MISLWYLSMGPAQRFIFRSMNFGLFLGGPCFSSLMPHALLGACDGLEHPCFFIPGPLGSFFVLPLVA